MARNVVYGLHNVSETLSEHIDRQIDILKQLGVKLEPEQIRHIKSLSTEIEVDNYARRLRGQI